MDTSFNLISPLSGSGSDTVSLKSINLMMLWCISTRVVFMSFRSLPHVGFFSEMSFQCSTGIYFRHPSKKYFGFNFPQTMNGTRLVLLCTVSRSQLRFDWKRRISIWWDEVAKKSIVYDKEPAIPSLNHNRYFSNG